MGRTKIRNAAVVASLAIAAIPSYGSSVDNTVQLKLREEHALISTMRDSAIEIVRKEMLYQNGEATAMKQIRKVREYEIEDVVSDAANADRQVDELFKSKRSWTKDDSRKLMRMNNDLEFQMHTRDTDANDAVGMILQQESAPEQPPCKICKNYNNA